MKTILLIGLGRFGRNVAKKLNELGHEVMAIDSSEERVNAVLPYLTPLPQASLGGSGEPYQGKPEVADTQTFPQRVLTAGPLSEAGVWWVGPYRNRPRGFST